MMSRLAFAVLGFLLLIGLAQAEEITPGAVSEKQRIFQQEVKIDATVRARFLNATVPSAKELLTPEEYSIYQAALWFAESSMAEKVVIKALKERMPELAKLFPGQSLLPTEELWQIGVSVQFNEIRDALFVSSLASSLYYAKKAGVLGRLLAPFDFDDDSVPAVIIEHQSDLKSLESSATKEASEVGMVGLARYLLDRHEGYPDEWFAYVKEFPLYLLLRSQIVAERRGNPGNRPPDFEALVEKARAAAGPDGVKLVEEKVANTVPRRFYRPLFRERLRAAGRPASDIVLFPPGFKAFVEWDSDEVDTLSPDVPADENPVIPNSYQRVDQMPGNGLSTLGAE
ncbi:MAG: hypothetical protein C0606_12245 [Hyphomicrobiales bacterium]|nr:MAG: hypothetical protein C0606_12245 [Hyphomicrobiales bacterium]